MKTKRAGKGSFLLRLCLAVLAIYIAASLVRLQMEIRQKQDQLQSLQVELEVQRLEKKDLERQLNMGDDEKYLGRIAREKLEMGFADEHMFKDAAG